MPKYYDQGSRLNYTADFDVLSKFYKDCICRFRTTIQQTLHKNDYLIKKQLNWHLRVQTEQQCSNWTITTLEQTERYVQSQQ